MTILVAPLPNLPCAGLPDAPSWLEAMDRLVLRASREIRPLAALSPVNAHSERHRLTAELQAKRPAIPRWTYAPIAHDELRWALDTAERMLTRCADSSVASLYLGRVRELSLEAALCGAAGTRRVGWLAHQRFGPRDPKDAVQAQSLSADWLLSDAPAPAGPAIASDSSDPRSLVSRMRAAVGRLRLPFSVVLAPALAPVAATGEDVILIATERILTEEDTLRTVLHEIDGHAQPRARALRIPATLFRAGTERGMDDQEGRALLLEERAGLLGPRRRQQLAARYRSVEAMRSGATFAEVAALLLDLGIDCVEAIVIAERAFRGDLGTRPGLGRERIYMEALVRVRRHLEAHPDDEHVLSCGQIGLDAIDAVRPFASDAPQLSAGTACF